MSTWPTFVVFLFRQLFDTRHEDVIVPEKLIQQEEAETVAKALVFCGVYKKSHNIVIEYTLVNIPPRDMAILSQITNICPISDGKGLSWSNTEQTNLLNILKKNKNRVQIRNVLFKAAML